MKQSKTFSVFSQTRKRTFPVPGKALSHIYGLEPGRTLLFAKLFEFICHKLYLGSDDDLNGGLARTHHTCNACGFDPFLIHLRVILDLQTKSGDAVIDRSYVLRTAYAFQNDLCYLSKVIVCKFHLSFICVIILTTRSLQIELNDNNTEYYIVDHADSQANRNQQPRILCQRSEGAKYHIYRTAGEGEACTDRKCYGNTSGDTG